jgi:hypothetical protein
MTMTKTGEVAVKRSRSEVHRKAVVLPELRFDDQQLTSFGGIVIFQKLFAQMQLKARLQRALNKSGIYGMASIVQLLIVHILIGFRELREVALYQEDPLIQRVLGLGVIPSAATLSRALKGADAKTVATLRYFLRQMVLDRLAKMELVRITVDFDGSVTSTKRRAEGTAVGFNKQKKGARSYYPLYATIAQTDQVLDFLHRPGNVHDSKARVLSSLNACELFGRAFQTPSSRFEWTARFSART